MSFFNRDHEPEHDHDEAQPQETLDFDVVKKGFDPEQVEAYVNHLIREHEEEIDLAQQRLLHVQHDAQVHAQETEQQLAEISGQLTAAQQEVARLHQEAAVLRDQASQPQVIVTPDDPEKDAQILEARGRIAQLEQQLQVAEQRRDELADEAATLRASLEASGGDQDAGKLAEQLSEAREEAKRLRERLEDAAVSGGVSDQELLAQLDEQRAESRRLAGEVQRMEEELSQLHARQEARDAHDEVLRNKLDELEREAIELRDRHAAACAERDEARDALNARAGDSEAEASRLLGERDALQVALDAARDRAEQERESNATVNAQQREQIAELSRQVSELDRQVITHQQEAANARRQLEQAQDRAEINAEQIQRLIGQLEKVRSDYTDALRDGAKATARVELLESEIAQLRARQDDFGEEARRMVQALRDSRAQQERELAVEREQAMRDAERIRQEAIRDAEQVRADALAAIEAASAERRQAADSACDAARAALADIRREVEAMAADAESRVASARDSEQQIRDAVKQAAQAELDALTRRREDLIADIADLQTQADRKPAFDATAAVDVPAPAVSAEQLDAWAGERERPAAQDITALDLPDVEQPGLVEDPQTQPESLVEITAPAEEAALVQPADAALAGVMADFEDPASVLGGEVTPQLSVVEDAVSASGTAGEPELVSLPEVAPLDLPPVSLDEPAAAAADVAPAPVEEPAVAPLDLPDVTFDEPVQAPVAEAASQVEALDLPPLELDDLPPVQPAAAAQVAPLDLPPQPPARPASPAGPNAHELAQRAAQRTRTTLDRSRGDQQAAPADVPADGPVFIDEDD